MKHNDIMHKLIVTELWRLSELSGVFKGIK